MLKKQKTLAQSVARQIWATSWENLFMSDANNKDADQPAHLASLCSWAGRFESYPVEIPEDRFSYDEAHLQDDFSPEVPAEARTHILLVIGW